jgi:hypothetical protein
MTQKDKTKQAGMTVDPAAIGLMASIVAKSITQFVRSSPQSNLASESLINDLSKTIAKDLITSIAQLAGQVDHMGRAPTSPGFVRKRAAGSYESNSGTTKTVDPFSKVSDKQYPETD